jgi:phosphatidylethanolamine/phosphatidyl-N-methylethanolamine N-methyltransferase
MKTSTNRKLVTIDAHNVKRAYARWEPVYDLVFGEVFAAGRRAAVTMPSRRGGRVPETDWRWASAPASRCRSTSTL